MENRTIERTQVRPNVKTSRTQQYNRGDIYMAELGVTKGSEQGGRRPVVIIQNDVGNKFSPTVIAVTMTSQQGKRPLPTHVSLNKDDYKNLTHNSVVLAEQIVTLDKTRLLHAVDVVNERDMKKIEKAVLISFGFNIDYNTAK